MAASQKSIVGPDPNYNDSRSTVKMSPLMFRATYDQDFKRENPELAALHAYRHRFQPQVSNSYILGQNYGRPALRGLSKGLDSMFSTGTLPSGLMGAAAGVGLGYLGAKGWNALSDNDIPTWQAMLAGGLTLGGLGAMGGHANTSQGRWPTYGQRNPYMDYSVSPEDRTAGVNAVLSNMYKSGSEKRAFYNPMSVASLFAGQSALSARNTMDLFNPYRSESHRSENDDIRGHLDARDEVLAILRRDTNVSPMYANALQSGVMRLSPKQAQQLLRLIAMGSGAAVGERIANFLLGHNLLPRIIGGLAGAAIGGSMFSGGTPQPRTAIGQPLGSFLG